MAFIISSDMYCDICNPNCEDDVVGHISLGMVDTLERALAEIEEDGWIEKDGKHICDKCQEKGDVDGK